MTASATDSSGVAAIGNQPGFRGWHMVARGFLCQNVANGFVFGTFGVSMLAMQHRLGSDRTMVSLGMSLTLLSMGLLSPFTASILQQLTLRWTMLCGLILSASGYVLLAFAPSTLFFLLAYALLIGPAIAMFGSLPSSILAGNWFVARQGAAIGMVNIPLVVTFAPIAAIWLLDSYGLVTLYLSMAAIHILLVPAVLTIVERPSLIGQEALGVRPVAPAAAMTDDVAAIPPVALLRQKTFWIMVGGGGVLNAVGIIGMSHIVALTLERGLSALAASLLVSVIGGAAMLGAPLAGILCDRIGPVRTLALAAAGIGIAWAGIYTASWLPALVLAVAVHGIAVGGVYPSISVLARRLFGADAMARAIGLFFPLTLPFTFSAPPLAGWLRDRTGSYDALIIVVVISCALVCAMFLGLWRADLRHAHRIPSHRPV